MALFCCGRLGNRQVFGALCRFPASFSTAQSAQAAAGAPKVSFKKFEAPASETFDDKNARLSRPMSPHLTIYHFQLPAVLSITHRATGMMLTGYMTALGVGALVLPNDISHYISILESTNLSPATIFLAKFILATPFGYHFANGIRHLYWDTAKGLSIEEVYKTGYTMLAIAAATTLGLAAL